MFKAGTILLLTLDNAMAFADGCYYSLVAGPCEVIKAEDLLGLTPERSANWFLKIGGPDNPQPVLVAGCQIHYAQVLNKITHAPSNAKIID